MSGAGNAGFPAWRETIGSGADPRYWSVSVGGWGDYHVCLPEEYAALLASPIVVGVDPLSPDLVTAPPPTIRAVGPAPLEPAEAPTPSPARPPRVRPPVPAAPPEPLPTLTAVTPPPAPKRLALPWSGSSPHPQPSDPLPQPAGAERSEPAVSPRLPGGAECGAPVGSAEPPSVHARAASGAPTDWSMSPVAAGRAEPALPEAGPESVIPLRRADSTPRQGTPGHALLRTESWNPRGRTEPRTPSLRSEPQLSPPRARPVIPTVRSQSRTPSSPFEARSQSRTPSSPFDARTPPLRGRPARPSLGPATWAQRSGDPSTADAAGALPAAADDVAGEALPVTDAGAIVVPPDQADASSVSVEMRIYQGDHLLVPAPPRAPGRHRRRSDGR